jgi:adenosine deaminase
MLAKGVSLTLNVDDPLFFRTTLTEEFATVQERWSLADRELAAMTAVGLQASGASPQTRERIRSALAAWLSDQPYDGRIP